MPSQNLLTYLQDHASGSVGALEMLEHLEKKYPDHSAFFKKLHDDIMSERKVLDALIEKLGGAGTVRRAMAWLGEKAAQLKLQMGSGDFHLLEGVEMVAIGIEGKRSLWEALKEASKTIPELQGPDYVEFAVRSVEQRQRIEPVRLMAALASFKS